MRALRRVSLSLIALLFLGCTGSEKVATTSGNSPHSVAGQVMRGGQPVSGVTVTFLGADAPPAVTSETSGNFSQSRFPPGNYTIQLSDGVHDFYYQGQLSAPNITVDSSRTGLLFEAVPRGSRVDLLSPNGGGNALLSGQDVTVTFRVTGSPGDVYVIDHLRDDSSNFEQSLIKIDPLTGNRGSVRRHSFSSWRSRAGCGSVPPIVNSQYLTSLVV